MSELKNLLDYLIIYLRIYVLTILHWFNRHLLKTYPLIKDCARCQDCGRNVHDFLVPNKIWERVYGSKRGILCYDCFCNRADEKFRIKWRMQIFEWTNLKTGEKQRISMRK